MTDAITPPMPEPVLTPADLDLRLLRGQNVQEGDLSRLPGRPILGGEPPAAHLPPDLRLLHLNLQWTSPEAFVEEALATLRQVRRRAVIRTGSPDHRSADEHERGDLIIRTLLLVHLTLRPDALTGEAAELAWAQHTQLQERWANHDNGETLSRPIEGNLLRVGLNVSEREFSLLSASIERARTNLKSWNPRLRLSPDHDMFTWLQGVGKSGTVWAKVRPGAALKLSGPVTERASDLILTFVERHEESVQKARDARRTPPLVPLPRPSTLTQLEADSPWRRGSLSSECARLILTLCGHRTPSLAVSDLRAQIVGALATHLSNHRRRDLLTRLRGEVVAINDDLRQHSLTVTQEGREALARAEALTAPT